MANKTVAMLKPKEYQSNSIFQSAEENQQKEQSFSYFKKGITDKNPQEPISFNTLCDLIKDNPVKEKITYLRTLEYKSAEYSKTKNKLPNITPHGTFNNKLNGVHFNTFSGYLYFDIDKAAIDGDLNEYKQFILQSYPDQICLLATSIGGRGLQFFINVSNSEVVKQENFKQIHTYFRTKVFSNLPTDKDAAKLTQQLLITYDQDVYINDTVSVTIPLECTELKTHDNNQSEYWYNSMYKMNTDTGYTLTYTRCFIDIKILLQKLAVQTAIEYNSQQDYIIEPIEFFKTYIPRIIPDGKKHSIFRGLTNGIIYLNPEVSLLELHSYIYFINLHFTGGRPMELREMLRTVQHVYDNYKNSGIVHVKTKIKKVHTNPNLDGETRKLIANQQNGRLRKEESIKKIISAMEALNYEGILISQSKVSQLLEGVLGITTIKTHWQKVLDILARENLDLFCYYINEGNMRQKNRTDGTPNLDHYTRL